MLQNAVSDARVQAVQQAEIDLDALVEMHTNALPRSRQSTSRQASI